MYPFRRRYVVCVYTQRTSEEHGFISTMNKNISMYSKAMWSERKLLLSCFNRLGYLSEKSLIQMISVGTVLNFDVDDRRAHDRIYDKR